MFNLRERRTEVVLVLLRATINNVGSISNSRCIFKYKHFGYISAQNWGKWQHHINNLLIGFATFRYGAVL